MTEAGVRRATAAFLAASLFWLAAILAAPHALDAAPAAPRRLGAGVIYLAGHVVCHQRPERPPRRTSPTYHESTSHDRIGGADD